jgi:hypothetical protein
MAARHARQINTDIAINVDLGDLDPSFVDLLAGPHV